MGTKGALNIELDEELCKVDNAAVIEAHVGEARSAASHIQVVLRCPLGSRSKFEALLVCSDGIGYWVLPQRIPRFHR